MNETIRARPDRVTVFAARGSYASPAAFIDGFRAAEWTAAAVAAVGVPIAALAPSKSAARGLAG